MSKRRRVMESSGSESGSEDSDSEEEADGHCSMIWKAAGPLTMRQDMQHDSQVVHSLRTGDLVKQTKPAVTYDWGEVRTGFRGGGSYGPGGGRLGDVLARHRVSAGPRGDS